MATWNKEYNPEEVASGLEKIRIDTKKGKISFIGPPYLDYTVVLNSMVCLNPEIPNIEKTRIIREAIPIAAKKGRISAKPLLAGIGKLESEYIKRPLKKYKLVTSIPYIKELRKQFISSNGCTIVF